MEAYTNTVNDIRRLRSTRLDKQLGGSSARKARQSRIIEGPEADSVRPGSSEGLSRDRRRGTSQFRIVEDTFSGDNVVERSFGDDKALTLDDIPRIVAAEQAREQRPNAFKHQRPYNNVSSPAPTLPRLVNGYQRDPSAGKSQDAPPTEAVPQARKRYFSELTALDAFIVRHLAVLNMEPLVHGHFNLEELLGLIDTNKKTFWGKFGKAFQPNDKKRGGKKKGLWKVYSHSWEANAYRTTRCFWNTPRCHDRTWWCRIGPRGWSGQLAYTTNSGRCNYSDEANGYISLFFCLLTDAHMYRLCFLNFWILSPQKICLSKVSSERMAIFDASTLLPKHWTKATLRLKWVLRDQSKLLRCWRSSFGNYQILFLRLNYTGYSWHRKVGCTQCPCDCN